MGDLFHAMTGISRPNSLFPQTVSQLISFKISTKNYFFPLTPPILINSSSQNLKNYSNKSGQCSRVGGRNSLNLAKLETKKFLMSGKEKG